MVNAIDQRFDQPSFETYASMEFLLVKTLKAQDNSTELQFLENVYSDDVNWPNGNFKSAAEGWRFFVF